MKKVLLALGILISLVIVVIAGGLIYLVNFDPNENKTMLAQKFKDATGRDLTLAGDIGLTVYPWLGITLNAASIGNAAGFSATPMLQVQHAAVRVKLLPLLRGEYEIDTVRLQGAHINLEVAGSGANNWDDLAGSDASAPENAKSDGAAVKNIILGGVAIEDTRLVYDNQLNDTHYEINNLAMTVAELVYGEPLGIALSMDLLSQQPQLASKVNLAGTVIYDVDNGLYNLDPLTLNATLSGPDVPSGTSITLATALSVNLEEDTLSLDNLQLDTLDTRVTATIMASRVQTDEPAVHASLNATGENLAAIFRILERTELAQRISTLNNAFNISANVDADMASRVVMIPDLQMSLLGAEITGNIQASALDSEQPAASGNLKAAGPDLPTLVEVVGILQGGSNGHLSGIGRQLQAVPDKNFAVQTSFAGSMATGEINIPEFSIAMFGATLNGTLTGTGIHTETPALQGQLVAKGADMPLLMQIAGQLQGGVESTLNQYGAQLGRLGDRTFTMTTHFNADLKQGNIQLAALDAAVFGFQLHGTLDAKQMQASNGTVTGALTLTGENLREVLTAIDQPDLAQVAQSMSLNLDVSGSSNNITISPLRFDLVVSGTQIQNSPQTITLNADAVVNPGNDSINIDKLTLSGLDLNMNGKFSANNISSDMSYSGAFELPAFNARKVLEQLNQQVPATNDNTVLQKVALQTAFVGTNNSVDVKELTLTLDDTTLKGTMAVSDFNTSTTRFTLDVDSIDADRYLVPDSTSTAASSTESTPLAVDALRALDVQGSINIGSLTISGLRMNSIVVAMNAAAGELALSPVRAELYDGTFTSDMRLNVNGTEPTATLSTTLSSINLGPLLQDFMDATYLSGSGNIQLGLSGTGADITSIKRNLNGNGSVSLEDGVLTGVDVGGVLSSIETMIRSKRVASLPQGGATPFDNFSATLDIRNGIVASNDLLIQAPGWKVNGAGTLVDLTNDSINYNLVATVEPATATSNTQEFDIGGYSLPIACKGSISSPSCLPDAQQIIANAVTGQIQERIGGFLRDRLGGAEQPQPAPGTDDASEEEQTPDAPQPAEETPAADDLLNRTLDRLLR